MAFTLAKASARRNGHRPPPRRCPGPHPLAEPVGRVVVTHSAREARGVPLALHPHPAHRSHRERVERGGIERSEEHTSELQSRSDLVCRLLLEKKKKQLCEQIIV